MLAELLAVSKFVAFGLIIDLLHVLQSFPFPNFSHSNKNPRDKKKVYIGLHVECRLLLSDFM